MTDAHPEDRRDDRAPRSAAGHAYAAEGHVLFAVSSFGDYGRLSGRAREDMIAGARVEVAPYKRDAADFVLWKPSPPDIVGWQSPWGRGRPGWHIECSTMAEQHLGDTIDIHGGGTDLVFPHHENEIAQSTCAHDGALYARYWLHNGMLNFERRENVEVARQHRADSRSSEVATRGKRCVSRCSRRTTVSRSIGTSACSPKRQQKLDRMYGSLREAGVAGSAQTAAVEPPASVLAALDDDLNTPQALAELFGLVRAANRSTDPDDRRALAAQLRAGGQLLGLLANDPAEWFAGGAVQDAEAAEIDALVARRDELRRARNFTAADRIRDTLAERGIVLEDVAGGVRWRRAR